MVECNCSNLKWKILTVFHVQWCICPLKCMLNKLSNFFGLRSARTTTASSQFSPTYLLISVSYRAETLRHTWRCVTMISVKQRNSSQSSCFSVLFSHPPQVTPPHRYFRYYHRRLFHPKVKPKILWSINSLHLHAALILLGQETWLFFDYNISYEWSKADIRQ